MLEGLPRGSWGVESRILKRVYVEKISAVLGNDEKLNDGDRAVPAEIDTLDI